MESSDFLFRRSTHEYSLVSTESNQHAADQKAQRKNANINGSVGRVIVKGLVPPTDRKRNCSIPSAMFVGGLTGVHFLKTPLFIATADVLVALSLIVFALGGWCHHSKMILNFDFCKMVATEKVQWVFILADDESTTFQDKLPG